MKTIRNYRQRGDTIVEVLMCVAVLGLVFSAVYATSNRNVSASRATQERLEAVKIAEGQIERLRIMVREDNSLYDRTTAFCISESSAGKLQVNNTDNAACHVTSTGEIADADITPRYNISAVKTATLTEAGVNGSRYAITVQWDSLTIKGSDKLDTVYEVYE